MNLKKLVLVILVILFMGMSVEAFDPYYPDKLFGDPSKVNNTDEFVLIASVYWDQHYKNPNAVDLPGFTRQWGYKQIINNYGSIIRTSTYRKDGIIRNQIREVYVFNKKNGHWKLAYDRELMMSRMKFLTFAEIQNKLPGIDRRTANQLNIPFRN